MEDLQFNELIKSTKEAKNILQEKVNASRTFFIEEPNAKEIREKYKLTQNEFANLLNISVNTLRNWEQGRRTPDGPAKVLLNIANTHPEVLIYTG